MMSESVDLTEEQTMTDWDLKMNEIRKSLSSTFNHKMNALNDLIKYMQTCNRSTSNEAVQSEDNSLRPENIVKWMKESKILELLMKDSLHHKQYMEKVEKIVAFLLKEKAFTSEDLSTFWEAQQGRHEVIVKNVYKIVGKIAWDFSDAQLDQLFDLFQVSWSNANMKQREKMLELLLRLAEDDKEDGAMRNKVLSMFWNVSHDDDVQNEILLQVLAAHVKILQCHLYAIEKASQQAAASTSQSMEDLSSSNDTDVITTIEREDRCIGWLMKCVEEITSESWVLPAMKLIKDVVSLYDRIHTSCPKNNKQSSSKPAIASRVEVIRKLESQYQLVELLVQNLSKYMNTMKKYCATHPDVTADYCPDNRFNHASQIQDRMDFLLFILKDGRLSLQPDHLDSIWNCLVRDKIFDCDREEGFSWFCKLVESRDGDGTYNEFFQRSVLQLEPAELTDRGMQCFEVFFKSANKFEERSASAYNDASTSDLIGADYVWKVLAEGSDSIANKAISLLKVISIQWKGYLASGCFVKEYHELYTAEIMDRLHNLQDELESLMKNGTDASNVKAINTQVEKIRRLLKVFYEYITECDSKYTETRMYPPFHTVYLGSMMNVTVRFPQVEKKPVEDVLFTVHANNTIGDLRALVNAKSKALGYSGRWNMYHSMAVLLDDDTKLLSECFIRDKSVILLALASASVNFAPDYCDMNSPLCYEKGSLIEMKEETLPSVVVSKTMRYVKFLFRIGDIAIILNNEKLHQLTYDILKVIPINDVIFETINLHLHEAMESKCANNAEMEEKAKKMLCQLLFGNLPSSPETVAESPTKSLYALEVFYTMMWSASDVHIERNSEFLFKIFSSNFAHYFLDAVKEDEFLFGKTENNLSSVVNVRVSTKRLAWIALVRINKVILVTLANILLKLLNHEPDILTVKDNKTRHYLEITLNNTFLIQMPQTSVEPSLRSMIHMVALKFYREKLTENATSYDIITRSVDAQFPELQTIVKFMNLVWASSNGSLDLLVSDNSQASDFIHVLYTSRETTHLDVMLFTESIETLCMTLLMNRCALSELTSFYANELVPTEAWKNFVTDLLLRSDKTVIRLITGEQLCFIMNQTQDNGVVVNCISVLYVVLNSSMVTNNRGSTHEYFVVFCKLLNILYTKSKKPLPFEDAFLEQEVAWLARARDVMKSSPDMWLNQLLLEGHLGIFKELIIATSNEKKLKYGIKGNPMNLVRELLENFIFPSSRLMQIITTKNFPIPENTNPICSNPQTISLAFDIVIALCSGVLSNIKCLIITLTALFFGTDEDPIMEWEYYPEMFSRPMGRLTGLRNAGATCYMNAVLQQLFMLECVRTGILSVDVPFNENDFNDEKPVITDSADGSERSVEQGVKEYCLKILKEIQKIFGNLAASKVSFYVPYGLWRNFKLHGRIVNVREQQDVVEFFMCLVDCVDEATKAISGERILGTIFGGSYLDQKISKECPHRYSQEEPFNVFPVDIKSHTTLIESLEQYVKGDILEGSDAYHCEQCNKKVATEKQVCIKLLPPVLVMQLKRFEFDFEKNLAIKSNSYFEFPRKLDMKPYLVSEVAKREGDQHGTAVKGDPKEDSQSTNYELTGVVVHSGQANGGHYYSFARRLKDDGTYVWYKFDDQEVTEHALENDVELRFQCFGGEHFEEDAVIAKTTYAKNTKKWWGAYMLFYSRTDANSDALSVSQRFANDSRVKIPDVIMRNITQHNVRFIHHRNQFNTEFFQFVKKVARLPLQGNGGSQLTPSDDVGDSDTDLEVVYYLVTEFLTKFLLNVGLRTKKFLRGSTTEWFDYLKTLVTKSAAARAAFAYNAVVYDPRIFARFIFNCPSIEIRTECSKFMTLVISLSMNDPTIPLPDERQLFVETRDMTLGHQILIALLELKDVIFENSRCLTQYFTIFKDVMITPIDHVILLKVKVPQVFIALITEDITNMNTIRYPSPDFAYCVQVLCTLIRNCDVRSRCTPSTPDRNLTPNPYGHMTEDKYLCKMPSDLEMMIYEADGFMKKIMVDQCSHDAIAGLLQYLSWENVEMSKFILFNILWHMRYSSIISELNFYTQLMLPVLLVGDYYQESRIDIAVFGSGQVDAQNCLLGFIRSNKGHNQKKAYLCLKLLVQVFVHSEKAVEMFMEKKEFHNAWWSSVSWLKMELNKKAGFGFSGTNVHATSGFGLERSNSAKRILERALTICPSPALPTTSQSHDLDEDEEDIGEEEGSSKSEIADVVTPVIEELAPSNRAVINYPPIKSSGLVDKCAPSTSGMPAQAHSKDNRDSSESPSALRSCLKRTCTQAPSVSPTLLSPHSQVIPLTPINERNQDAGGEGDVDSSTEMDGNNE